MNRQFDNSCCSLAEALVDASTIAVAFLIVRFVSIHDRSAIGIMVIIVYTSPSIATYIAELISTFTSHMIAPLILFYNELAFLALAIVKVGLEEMNLMKVAFT